MSEFNASLYDGKFFYEVLKYPDHIRLVGPLENIYYTVPAIFAKSGFAFVQVMDAQVDRMFFESEILVIDKII